MSADASWRIAPIASPDRLPAAAAAGWCHAGARLPAVLRDYRGPAALWWCGTVPPTATGLRVTGLPAGARLALDGVWCGDHDTAVTWASAAPVLMVTVPHWRPGPLPQVIWQHAAAGGCCTLLVVPDAGAASFRCQVRLASTTAAVATLEWRVVPHNWPGMIQRWSMPWQLTPGRNVRDVVLACHDGQRWWPQALGHPSCYRIELGVTLAGQTSWVQQISGFRTLRHERDVLAVNGVRRFIAGARADDLAGGAPDALVQRALAAQLALLLVPAAQLSAGLLAAADAAGLLLAVDGDAALAPVLAAHPSLAIELRPRRPAWWPRSDAAPTPLPTTIVCGGPSFMRRICHGRAAILAARRHKYVPDGGMIVADVASALVAAADLRPVALLCLVDRGIWLLGAARELSVLLVNDAAHAVRVTWALQVRDPAGQLLVALERQLTIAADAAPYVVERLRLRAQRAGRYLVVLRLAVGDGEPYITREVLTVDA
jgi:hypothetical protein